MRDPSQIDPKSHVSHVFISYSKDDMKEASILNEILKAAGVITWIDYERLLPGQQWKNKIRKAIEEARAYIFLASSNSVNKRGFVQTEVKEILDKIKEFPTGDISVIVARLDQVELRDEAFLNRHWIDLFPDFNSGYSQLLQALNTNETEELIRDEKKRISEEQRKQRINELETFSDQIKKKEADSQYKLAHKTTGRLFYPDDLDIYVNKLTLEAYIFHGKIIDYEAIDHLIYHRNTHDMIVVYSDGKMLDLGVKIQWLLRPHWVKVSSVNIVRTKDGNQVDGINVPLVQKGKQRKIRGVRNNVSNKIGFLRHLLFRNWFNKIKDS